ncbi:MAG: hypothetical protein IPM54_27950 [Polyangiaceae bacterium]|nr:hypothetical protein [Polyangiaceae bacterium]
MPQTYALLNLTDLRLGLEDLLSIRRDALLRTQVGKAQESILEEQRKAILALPAPLTGGKPFAEELALRHAEVDSFGMGIWYLTEAYLRVPGVDPAIVEAVKRVRHALIPNTDRLRDAYPEQAAAAEVRRQNVPSIVEDLLRIPLAGGKTLYDWAMGFVYAGERIATTLAQRAEINAGTRKHAMTLLGETLHMLNELRQDVIAEIERTIGMPTEIEHDIFGYFDVLESTRAEAKRALEQNQAIAGPTSTRGLTFPPPSTQFIQGPSPSSPGYLGGPSSTRVIAPLRDSSSGLSPIPPSTGTIAPPPSVRGPKRI